MLEEKIKEYFELKNNIDKMVEHKEALGAEIKGLLSNEPDQTYTTAGGLKATVVNSTTFKYDDKTAIIEYLTKKGLGDIYLTKDISTKKLNAELKNEGMLYENLKTYLTKTVTESLKVTE